MSPNDPQPQIDALTRRLDDLETRTRGSINFNTDILGLFETVSTAPTHVPKTPYDQVKIYVNSTTYRLYWYDATGNTWHYVSATA